MRRHYQPNNMIFFSFGKTPFSKVVKQVERYFKVDVKPAVGSIRIAPTYREPLQKLVEKNTMQTHVMLGWYADSLYAPQKIVYYFINNLLGGGSVNSRLNSSIREKHGLVYNVESNVALYSDTGFFSIYFATDPKNKDKCIKLINKEITRLKEEELTPMQLTTAKRQWKGHLGIASEINENSALNMAKSFLHLNRYSSIDKIFGEIDDISSKQIIEMANKLFSEDGFELVYQKC
jgi:predicted Zn-dependent peptidase